MKTKNGRKILINFAGAFLATATIIAASATSALAGPKVELGKPVFRGSGCPGGSASAIVSPDGEELSITFDKYSAFANSTRESRKSCNFVLPIKVPSGYQVSFFDADYRGYVAPNTTGRLRAEYFFAGSRGPVFIRNIRGELDYNVRDKLMGASWSRCGDSLNMRINSSMAARGRGMAAVDSLDLARRGGLIYHIKYRGCNK